MPCHTWKIPKKIHTFWILHLLSIWNQDGSEIIVHIPWPSMEWACASLEWLKSLKILELESMLCGLELVWGFKNENPQISIFNWYFENKFFIIYSNYDCRHGNVGWWSRSSWPVSHYWYNVRCCLCDVN